MGKYYKVELFGNTLPDSFIRAEMRDAFREMAILCGVTLQLPDAAPKPTNNSGLQPASYNLLKQLLDQYKKTNDSAIPEKIMKLSEAVGYWIFNEFYLPLASNLVAVPTDSSKYKSGESSGVVNEPILIDPN